MSSLFYLLVMSFQASINKRRIYQTPRETLRRKAAQGDMHRE